MSDPDGLLAAVQGGDRVRALQALRDRLAAQIDASESGRDIAALAGRLESVLTTLAAVAPVQEGTPLDELSRRRAGFGDSPRPARSSRSAQ